MAPVIKAFEQSEQFAVMVAVTGQHRQMLDQVLSFFEIIPDIDLDLMKPGQSLADTTAAVVSRMDRVLAETKPDLIMVQGDTTTAFAAALSAYYLRIPIGHIEAGLRSHDKYAPFPEEMNRVMTGHLADLHFAPTDAAAANLEKEGITAPVHVVGNSVIDALLMGIGRLEGEKGEEILKQIAGLPTGRPYVLITGHRRESFGRPFEEICMAIADAAERFPDIDFVYPVHLNPNVQDPVRRLLGGRSNIHLLPPVEYPVFLQLMKNCRLVLTDSGGIQEEAPTLGKPVLVMREVTERMEGVEAGTARLVGVRREDIFRHLSELLTDDAAYDRMAKAVNPYGDGLTSSRIVRIVSGFFSTQANAIRP